MTLFNSKTIENANAPLLERYRRATTPQDAIAIIDECSQDRTPEAIAPLLEALNHHHPNVPPVAIRALVELAPQSVDPLIRAYRASTDQSIQARIIQALARIGDPRAVDVLIEVVGVSIANHCQGNVRRVAARGLGQIGCNAAGDITRRAIAKLTWALRSPEDWALRYAAAVSLGEIGTPEAIAALQQAADRETDAIVQLRIQTAVERSSNGK